MPGVRATNKKQFTAAFQRSELDDIDKLAKKLGFTRTELLRRAAADFVAKWNKRQPQSK